MDKSAGTQATFLTRMFKHQEREVKVRESTPVEQIREKSKAQITRMKMYKEEVKGGIADQIKGNQERKKTEKFADREIGERLQKDAEDAKTKEEQFLILKREKATHILKKQWAEQIQLKNNE